MGNALRDQLLKAGLIDDKRLRQADKEKRKEERQAQGRKPATSEDQVRLQQARAEKAARDRELNRQRNETQQNRARSAEIRQLIEANRRSGWNGDVPFNFADGGAVKRLYLSEAVRAQIVRGAVAIVRFDAAYELVDTGVASRIRERDPGTIVLWNEGVERDDAAPGDDPYAAFQVPDDLVW
ncbi:MAG: DUF2058 domain-containing protein [Methylotetracoccus sp.]